MDVKTLGGLLTALSGHGGMEGFRPILEQAEASVMQLGELVPAGAYAVERLETAPPGKGVNNMVNDMSLKRKAKLLPLMLRVIDKVTKCGEYMADDFTPTRSDAGETTWQAVEALARRHGAVEFGFARIDENDIFQDLAIPYRNAIVFTIDMDKAAIDTAPGYDALIEVVTTYAALGTVAIALTEHLRGQGYAAYPGFPIGGLVDYVRVAQQAGIGGIGYHGLLISPTAGTRQRIDVVFTNMEIPEPQPSSHEWILDFCADVQQVRAQLPAASHPHRRRGPPGDGPKTDRVSMTSAWSTTGRTRAAPCA